MFEDLTLCPKYWWSSWAILKNSQILIILFAARSTVPFLTVSSLFTPQNKACREKFGFVIWVPHTQIISLSSVGISVQILFTPKKWSSSKVSQISAHRTASNANDWQPWKCVNTSVNNCGCTNCHFGGNFPHRVDLGQSQQHSQRGWQGFYGHSLHWRWVARISCEGMSLAA